MLSKNHVCQVYASRRLKLRLFSKNKLFVVLKLGYDRPKSCTYVTEIAHLRRVSECKIKHFSENSRNSSLSWTFQFFKLYFLGMKISDGNDDTRTIKIYNK